MKVHKPGVSAIPTLQDRVTIKGQPWIVEVKQMHRVKRMVDGCVGGERAGTSRQSFFECPARLRLSRMQPLPISDLQHHWQPQAPWHCKAC